MPSADLRARSEHRVTFFRSAEYVATHLTAFVESGLLAGETVFVIAPAERQHHLTALLAERRRPGADPTNPALVRIDADELLQQIAPGDVFDFDAANQVLTRIVATGPNVRVYGEVLSRFARRGLLSSALQLESLGHALAHLMDVPVLCGYDAAHLSREHSDVDRIGDLHDRSVAESSDDARPGRTSARPLVLLADNDEDGRDMYGEYLRYAGFRVITAADGAEAMRLAEAYSPDVILMDVPMPRVDGFAAMQTMKADRRLRRTPIVAFTAHVLEDERANMLAGGFDDVIARPCLPDRLVLAIQQVVQI